jgi:nucleoside-diphosphate-sugar epimerase
MQVLITGGNGRLARTLATALTPQETVRLVDEAFTGERVLGVEWRTGDLRDKDFVQSALEGIDVIIHLAPITTAEPDDLEALDRATRGTYVLVTAALAAGIGRFILGSTLDLFDRLPAAWQVTEWWRPRPEPRMDHLAPWLAELSVRECVRSSALSVLCLRFGRIVDWDEIAAHDYDPRWLHLEDAIHALQRALNYLHADKPPYPWRIFHIAAAGPLPKIRVSAAASQSFGYEPAHDFAAHHAGRPQPQPEAIRTVEDLRPYLAPVLPIRSRPIRNVVIFGAGGPVAAVLAQELLSSYTLRLTDILPIAQIAAEGQPQSHGAPLPVPLAAPHECRVVDVRDPEAVMAACEGMDAIINCSVMRFDPAEAFRVNTLGAYNVMRAAVAHGIRRVVHTGPQQVDTQEPACYNRDYDVPGDAPSRPGTQLYFHTKFLGQEICRVYAAHYDLEVPVLLYALFRNEATDNGTYPFSISWQDAARSLRRALEVRSLPSPYEVMNIVSDIPYGRYSNQRAKTLLDWEPRDLMPQLWIGDNP